MRNYSWAALAAGCLLAGAGVASAQDTVRLGGPSALATIEEGSSTELVHRRSYGYGGRSYYGGGFGRSYYGGGFGRSYYGGYYGRGYAYYPRAYSYYSPSYYYPPTYYYSPSYYYSEPQYYYYPIAGGSTQPPATTLQGNYQPQPFVAPMPPANGNGTYHYDGGPRTTVPIPIPEANPASPPRNPLPADGRLVSQPSKTGGSTPKVSVPRVTYPAYGE